jgi:SanA protein
MSSVVARLAKLSRSNRIRLVTGAVLAALAFAMSVPNALVYRDGARRITPEQDVDHADAILVLGAKVFPDGRPSDVLRDRLEVALRLYRRGVARTVLLTGDHAEPGYDEPGAMAAWLVSRGVPKEAIVQDGLGLDTYSSMARAKTTFRMGRVVVVTQAFHLPRALYLAGALGLESQGVVADARRYRRGAYYQVREVASRVRAFVDVARARRVPESP